MGTERTKIEALYIALSTIRKACQEFTNNHERKYIA
ncbi:hypothetical protein SAMN04490209_3554 [Pseudomonas rhodesiae]|uniref:Uncharacterized protein n=1 Tax=Pseudomonas rhodesiae TaxID=76760 RepID=A0AAE8HEA7_9PSED|nr:hypothetical protein SAMN04490209_3554 [Pseudomonas rhodesiae]